MAVDYDFLVVGSGLAGLNAALELAQHGKVAVLTKRRVADSATSWAQGGIASVMAEDDSVESHLEDTLEAGAGLCDEGVARSIIEDGPRAIESLIQHGVAFDRGAGGDFDLTREGGHSIRRVLHAADFTGREIMRALTERAEASSNIDIYRNHIAVNLVTLRKLGRGTHDRCVGAYVLDISQRKVLTFRAKATLLATGGAGKVYLYTSNPDVATGDGVAMAFRAGAEVACMEFFQFHPTCLFHPHAKSFLISEALRGEGGILRLRDGTPFMKDVHPLADLAPRDIVARAIDREMKRSGDDYVTLDMTGLDPAYIATRFPNIHTACLSLGIDMTRTPIPVVPAAHYLCGGIKTDRTAETSIPALWAAGETAYTGFHGANRLASNSLLEALVMSRRAAEGMASFVSDVDFEDPVREWDAGSAVDADEMVVVSHNWDELRRAMWSYVSIVRSDKRLQRAADRIRMLQEEIQEYYWNFNLTPDLLELRHLSDVAGLIVASAQHRRESRGLHFNIDCPDAKNSLAKPTVAVRGRRSIQWVEQA